MAARIVTETREILGIRSKVPNPRIHRSACTLHQRGQAPTPTRFARSFEHEPQPLLDQILELATPQCRLRLGPAVEMSDTLTVVFIARPILATINPYLRMARQKQALLSVRWARGSCDAGSVHDRPRSRSLARTRRQCNEVPSNKARAKQAPGVTTDQFFRAAGHPSHPRTPEARPIGGSSAH
jgi:hypothetical protein